MASFNITDVFTITGRGTVLVGRIIDGTIHRGSTFELDDMEVTISGVETIQTRTVNPNNIRVGLLVNRTKEEMQIYTNQTITI